MGRKTPPQLRLEPLTDRRSDRATTVVGGQDSEPAPPLTIACCELAVAIGRGLRSGRRGTKLQLAIRRAPKYSLFLAAMAGAHARAGSCPAPPWTRLTNIVTHHSVVIITVKLVCRMVLRQSSRAEAQKRENTAKHHTGVVVEVVRLTEENIVKHCTLNALHEVLDDDEERPRACQ